MRTTIKKIFLVPLTCAALVFSVIGCGKSDHSVGSPDADNAGVTYGVPAKENIQNEFEVMRTKTGYEDAINQIKKSAIFNKANFDTDEFIKMHGQHISNWSGKIDTIATSHGGRDAWVKIVSSNGAIYRMHDILNSSSIYRQLDNLVEGQNVQFTGVIQSRGAGKWESSLTERGSLKDPEFNIEFEIISALKNGVFVNPTMEEIKTGMDRASLAKEAESLASPGADANQPADDSLVIDGRVRNEENWRQPSGDVIVDTNARGSPSFDCAKARSTAEKIICSDDQLSSLDTELAGLLAQAKQESSDKKNLLEETRAAWNFREVNCKDKSCLLDWYADRKQTYMTEINKF